MVEVAILTVIDPCYGIVEPPSTTDADLMPEKKVVVHSCAGEPFFQLLASPAHSVCQIVSTIGLVHAQTCRSADLRLNHRVSVRRRRCRTDVLAGMHEIQLRRLGM